jgi:hypothetical protein
LRQGGTACLIGFLGSEKMSDFVFSLVYKAKTCKSQGSAQDKIYMIMHGEY